MSKELDKQDARSPINSFVLPTGWLDTETQEIYKDIELTEMTGEEEDMLASKKLSAQQRMDNLMVACTMRIGPYNDKTKIRQIVDELVTNDRYFLIYKIREISLGKIYKFSAPCPFCGDEKLRLVDLSEVSFPSLKDPKKRIYEGTLPKSKLLFKWRVQDGKREKSLNNAFKKNDSNIFTMAILQRLYSLDNKDSTIESVKKLTALDRSFLRDQFNEVEGLVDDAIEVECSNCGKEFKVEANIGEREFFFPSAL
jgi:hypothetical protein